MCAVLSSYARACAAKGVMLWGWREQVCSECHPLWGSGVPCGGRGQPAAAALCFSWLVAPSVGQGLPWAPVGPLAGRASACPGQRRGSGMAGGDGAGGLGAAPPLLTRAPLLSVDKDVGACPNSQVFLYNLTTCLPTCRSLSEANAHCLQGFAPVDGCGCPDGTFLDEKGRCVPLAKCSCYHRGLYLEAGEVMLKQEERWWVAWAGWGGPTSLPVSPRHGRVRPLPPGSQARSPPPSSPQRLPQREAALRAGQAARPE